MDSSRAVATLRNLRQLTGTIPLSSISKALPKLGRVLLWLIVLLNARALPFVWHIRVFRPVFYRRVHHAWIRFLMLFKSSRFEKLKLEDAWLDSITPVGENPFTMVVPYKTWASESCGPFFHTFGLLTSEQVLTRAAVNLFPMYLRSGGWIALAATHYHFIREIPMLASYEIRSTIAAWDQKWLYVMSRYVRKPDGKKKHIRKPTTPPPGGDGQIMALRTPGDELISSSATPLPTTRPQTASETESALKAVAAGLAVREELDGAVVHTVVVSQVCYKVGRITVPPALILATNGFTGTEGHSRASPPSPVGRGEEGHVAAGWGKFAQVEGVSCWGWRETPESERWWDQALGENVERLSEGVSSPYLDLDPDGASGPSNLNLPSFSTHGILQMAADFWQSSSYRRWIVDRVTLAHARDEDLLYVDHPEYLDFLAIHFANLITKLGKRLQFRQRVIATATAFFRRFYLKDSYCETDPFTVITACCYLAAKAEESPVHIKAVVAESRAVFSHENCRVKIFLLDPAKVAETEFYLVDDLEGDLVVFHPYRTLLSLCKETVSHTSSNPEEKGIYEMENKDEIYGDSRLELTPAALQTAWSIINDAYRSQLCLLHPPHLIAIAALYLTFILHPAARPAATQKSDQDPAKDVGPEEPAEARQPPRSSRQAGDGHCQPGFLKDDQDPVAFLAHLNVSLPAVASIAQEIISFFELWREPVDSPGTASEMEKAGSNSNLGQGLDPDASYVTPAILSSVLQRMRERKWVGATGRPVAVNKKLERTLAAGYPNLPLVDGCYHCLRQDPTYFPTLRKPCLTRVDTIEIHRCFKAVPLRLGNV
ncbi:hypothetical protein NLJ89_g2692 [Agrocybe chaxingu]|uniref:Cyclin-like domain-containing protein n=1 Tax=Agrocybe chaxingu TaxID=84603 RepID=A0A9W8K6T4_9AGAR|nr:hypothetical protein NLJ89_g2692 [Agrocybe chaxingu]